MTGALGVPTHVNVETIDQMIAVIDAMSSVERSLGNVLQISEKRQTELASFSGTSVSLVKGVIAGYKAVEFTRRVYLGNRTGI